MSAETSKKELDEILVRATSLRHKIRSTARGLIGMLDSLDEVADCVEMLVLEAEEKLYD